jgi:hypothetical protein
MDVREVDPRTERWSEHRPTYRVFWTGAVASHEHQLTGASNVGEVLAWAEENRGPKPNATCAEIIIEWNRLRSSRSSGVGFRPGIGRE